MVSFMIGTISAKYDNSFVRLVMGDNYVDMTNENIAKGDPFGVFKQAGEVPMFFFIASNNIFVAFVNFVAGIIFSVGAVYFLFRNAVMVGTFQYYFFSKGLGFSSI